MRGKVAKKARRLTLKVLEEKHMPVGSFRDETGQVVNPRRMLYQQIKESLK